MTPIAIFTYNRPEYVRKILSSLLRCTRLNDCRVFIFCDGAKKPEDAKSVEDSRTVVREYVSLLNAEIIEQDQNKGLAHSVVDGVTWLCQEFGRVIVLEDDFILHPFFLDFMLQSLDRFADNDRVAQIAGYLPPIHPKVKTDTFFLPVSSSCGWSTWQRAWKLFSLDNETALGMLEADPSMRTRFDLDDSYPFFNMLQSTISGHTDSWAVLWYLHTFYNKKLTLYPKHSLLWVGGFDSLATHTKSQKKPRFYDQPLDLILQKQWFPPITFPEKVQADELSFDKLKSFLRPKPTNTGILRIMYKAKSILFKLFFHISIILL